MDTFQVRCKTLHFLVNKCSCENIAHHLNICFILSHPYKGLQVPNGKQIILHCFVSGQSSRRPNMQASKLFFRGLSRGLTDEINIFMCKQISLYRNGFLVHALIWVLGNGMFLFITAGSSRRPRTQR